MYRLISIILLSISFISTYGQSHLGIKGSYSFSSMGTSEAESRPGFDIGGFYSTPISEFWFFQPGIQFSLDGVKASDKFSYDYSASLYSLETPLLFSFRFGNNNDLNFGLDAGIFARYNLFGSYWVGVEGGRIEPDLFDVHKRFDFGPQVGFSLKANNIYMASGLKYGLIKPWKDKKGHYYNFFISFGYIFEL